MAKLKNIYYGKVEVTNVDKTVRVKGINFERDPSADEAEEYKGNAWMRQWLKERGSRYIRVVNKKTKKTYVFTDYDVKQK